MSRPWGRLSFFGVFAANWGLVFMVKKLSRRFLEKQNLFYESYRVLYKHR